jgi:periplasmic protein CpxP/Spy
MKNKWLLYLVLFMLAANAALVTTLIIKNKLDARSETEANYGRHNNYKRSKNGFEEHLSNELHFNEEQRKLVSDYSKEFHQARKSIYQELNKYKNLYFEALSQDNPDTTSLSEIAARIGKLEAQKFKSEYTHYRNVRSVCDEKQAAKMDSLGRMHMQRKYNFDEGSGKKRCQKQNKIK